MVGVIAPWNYPWSIPFGEVAIALMAGNGVVLKPASLTPLIGHRIQEIFERAGVPEGLVRAVHGGGAVGQALVESSGGEDLLHGIGGGRPPGGRRVRAAHEGLGARAGRQGRDDRLRRRQPAERVSGCLWGGLANAGQTCSGIERVYVVKDVADRFVEGVVEGAKSLTVGDPLDWEHRDRPDDLARAAAAGQGARGRRRRERRTLHCGGPDDPVLPPGRPSPA